MATAILEAAQSLQGSVTVPTASGELKLVKLASVAGTGDEGEGRAESVSFDASTGRAYTTNAAQDLVDIFTIDSNGGVLLVGSIDLSGLPGYGAVNSVAVKNGLIAVAYQNADPLANGFIALFNGDGELITTLEAGVLPDHVTFSPDGTKLLVANEGEAQSRTDDPLGSISIIDVSGGAESVSQDDVRTIDFTSLNGSEALLSAAGVRLLAGQNAGQDFEPEYISVSPDGTRAYVTLQEVNAVAVIDLTDPTATAPLAILPLGVIDRSLAGNAFDASDRDGISLENFDVESLLQPDAIASFEVGGSTYFITANEGDARPNIVDEIRAGSKDYKLDPTAYPDAAALKDNNALGRLNVLTTTGDTDGDGDIDQITTYGGRGVSIFRQNADGTIVKVRETGGEFEAIIAATRPDLFNTEDGEDVDTRSDNKGPEPEGVTVGQVGDQIYAFITLERVGGVMVYNVTDPENASFVSYQPAGSTDYAPEVVTFVSAEDSPTGKALVMSANEGSGTLTVYTAQPVISGTTGDDVLVGTAGDDRIEAQDGDDDVRGGDGDDMLLGGGGNDRVNGGAGHDILNGGGGDDALTGGMGNDFLRGGRGDDTINGGAGEDTAQYSGNLADYVITVDRFGRITVADTVSDRDGTDLVQNVEAFVFNGSTLSAAEVLELNSGLILV